MSTVNDNFLYNRSVPIDFNKTWGKSNGYNCHLAIVRDDEGGYSAIVLNLPGAGSCGDSEEEAIANTKEAVAGMIESYKAEGADIPWIDQRTYTIPKGAKQKWILVHA